MRLNFSGFVLSLSLDTVDGGYGTGVEWREGLAEERDAWSTERLKLAGTSLYTERNPIDLDNHAFNVDNGASARHCQASVGAANCTSCTAFSSSEQELLRSWDMTIS